MPKSNHITAKEQALYNEEKQYLIDKAKMKSVCWLHWKAAFISPIITIMRHRDIKPENIVLSGEIDCNLHANIYSLGLVLYKLANQNKLPFTKTQRTSEAQIHRKLRGEAFPPPAGVSKQLADIIVKACMHQPENRCTSAQELYEALCQTEYDLDHTNSKIISETYFIQGLIRDDYFQAYCVRPMISVKIMDWFSIPVPLMPVNAL